MCNNFKSIITPILAATAVGALSLGLVSSAKADTILFQDNFEPPHAPLNATINTITPQVGLSYTVDSPPGVVRDTNTIPPGTAVGGGSQFVSAGRIDRWFIQPTNISLTLNRTVSFSFDFYLNNDPTHLVNLVAYGSNDFPAIDLALYADGKISYFTGPDENVLFPAGGPGSFRRDQWVPVQFNADYGSGTFTATVDTYSFAGAFPTFTSLSGDYTHTFKNIYFAGPTTGSFYDNILISVPEPGTMVLCGVGILLAIRRRCCRGSI
jgi:hypothetical protein